MKTKILLLTLFNFIFLNSFAQNITVNITTAGHEPQVCASTQFNVEIALSGSFNFTNLQFGIQDITGLTFSGSPATSGIYKLYSQGAVICPANCNINFGFSIQYACSFIPPINGQVINLAQSLVLMDGQTPYQGNITWIYDNNTVNTQLAYQVKYFYMAVQGSLGAVLSNKGRTEERDIIFQNNGNIAFSGSMEFHDNFSCDDYTLSEIHLYERSGTTDVLITSFTPPASNGADHYFTYAFSGEPIDPGNQLVIKEVLEITSCLACAPGTMSTFNVTWGCPADLCRNATVSPSNVLRSGDRPKLTMYRMLPVPSGNLPNGGYWDQPGCTGDEINWKYRIGNDGTDIAYDIVIDLHNTDIASAYLIDLANVIAAPCTDPGCSSIALQEDVLLREVISMSGPHVKCAEPLTTPLRRVVYKIPQLAPGQYMTLTFPTEYCCPGLNNGSDPDPDVINLFDQAYFDKGFNKWEIDTWCKDECGILTGFYSDNPHPNTYTTLDIIGQSEEWHMEQILEVTTSDMTGITCPDPACSEANPVPFHIENKNLNNEWLNDVLLRYKYDATPFCSLFNNNPALMLMSVRIKMVFKMEDALRLYPIDANNIFIKNGTTTWTPSVFPSNDACVAANSMRTYEVIFDGADLADELSLANLDLKSFLHFINGSVTTFNLIPCCCSSNGNPDYTIQTYIEGLCADCWIPLTQIGSNVHVHCPGCITPGVQTVGASLIRDASSLGYPDAENDGLKDSNQQIDLSTYSEASNMKLNRSVQGDVLVSTVSGVFFDSNGAGCLTGAGMDYNTLKQRTCNASTCTSLLTTPYEFSHLYLDQTIPFSETNKFNLKLLTCTLTVTRSSQDVVYILSSADIDDINTNHHVGAQFLFDFTPADIATGNGPFASGFEFTPGEMYTARMTYKVCSNFVPVSESPADNKHMSEILNAFYFAVTDLPQQPFSSHAQFTDHFVDEDPNDPGYDCNALCHTDIFQCATFTSLHYFYSIHTKNGSAFLDYDQPTADGSMACKKALYGIARVNMGGSAQNIFPYEFRPAPVVNSFNLTIPTGYKVFLSPIPTLAPRWGTIFHTYGTCYPSSEAVSRKAATLPALTGTFTLPVTTVDAGPNMGLNLACSYDDWDPDIIKGDEHSDITIFMLFQPDNCPVTPATSLLASSDIQVEFASHDCAATGPVVKDRSCVGVSTPPCGALHKSSPQLNLTQINTPTISTTTFTIDVKFTNPPVSSSILDHAENVFLYFEPSSNYTVQNVVCLTTCTQAPQQSGNFWKLKTIRTGAIVDYRITFAITQCSGTPGTIAIPIYYGWNCVDYPTDINDATICSKTAANLFYIESVANVDNSIKINGLTNSFQYELCGEETLEVKIKSLEFGGINNIRVTVNLPNRLEFSATLPDLKYCSTATGCETVPVSTPFGSLFTFDLNLPSSTNGFLSNGSELTLTFYLTALCGYLGEIPVVKVRASKYCDNVNPIVEDMTLDLTWSFSGVDNCSPLCCSDFSATANSTDISCFGITDGTATASPVFGHPPFSYVWSTAPPQLSPTANNLPAGTYTCHLTDDAGCTATATVTITEPDAIDISFNSTNVLCHGGNNGEATVISSGGTGTHTYEWNNNETSATIEDLTAGIYTVIVTDANGCTATASIEIDEPDAISISMSSTPTCPGFSTGTATATAGGGTSPYTYSWSTVPAQTASTASGLSAGTYTCTVTDNNGCQHQETVAVSTNAQIVLSSPTDPAAIIPVSAAGANDGEIDLAVSGGSPPYTYAWSNTASTQDISNLAMGSYTVLVTDAYGCTATETYFVPEPPDECDGGFATYTQGGYGNCGAPGQILQNNFSNEFASGLMIGCTGGGAKQLTAGCYQAVRNFLPSGSIPAILNTNYSNPKGGCSTNGNCPCSTNTACVPANPVSYLNVFAGQVMTLTLNLGFDGLTGFSTNTVPLSQMYYVGSGPFYGLTVAEILTEANAKLGGCASTVGFSYTISELNNVVDLINKSWDNGQCPEGSCGILSCTVEENNFSLNSTTTVLQVACMPYNASCANGYAASILTSVHGGTPPYSYLWSTGDTDPDLTDLAPGIYALTVTDNDQNTAVRFAYVYSDATFSQFAYYSASVSNFTADFTDESYETSPGAVKTWAWNFGDPASGGNNTSTLQNPSHTFTTDGEYNVCLTVTYTSGLTSCPDVLCANVCIAPQASASPSSVSFCDGSGATLTVTVNGSNSYSYQWKKDGNTISGATASTYYATTAGSYTCVVSNSCGSSTTNAVAVTVNYLPPATISADGSTSICSGNSVTLNANTGTGLTYQWKLNSNNISGATSSSYAASASGDYTCAVTNICGSVTSNSITVTLNSLLPVSVSISATATTICYGTSVTFTATPTNGGSSPSYQWAVNGSNAGTNSATYENSSLVNSDVVTCVLTSNITPCATGNPATSNSVTMTVNPLPDANTGSNQNVCSGETIFIGAASVSGNTYAWSPSTYLSSASVSSPTFTSSTAGTTNYTLTETVTATSCQKSNGVSVTVISGGGNPTFTCNSSNLVVATPYTNCVSPGSNDYLMMQVKITLGGGCSGAQRKLQTLKFNAASATCSNIENAKLWYSGNSGSFSNAQVVSGSGTITSVSCTANNTWNAGTLQVMQPGDNYFWVTFKIRSTANIGESVQASLVSVGVVANGNTTCSTFGGSTASRVIQSSGCASVRIDNPEGSSAGISMTVFPNPFTDKTTFRFVSQKDVKIILELFDISGQKLKTLYQGEIKEGEVNEIELYTSGMGAGMYYYRLTSEEETGFGKLLIVR